MPSIAMSSTAKTASIPTEKAPRPLCIIVSCRAARRFGGAAVAPDGDADLTAPLDEVDQLIARRKAEADEFYAAIHPPGASADERDDPAPGVRRPVVDQAELYLRRQRLARRRLPDCRRRPRRACTSATSTGATSIRCASCVMPDKWEYPWFAAWDLAFQCVPLRPGRSADTPRTSSGLLLFEQFQHPNGQIPAYEWEFSDLNPPVHAWAVWRVYNMDRIRAGKADRAFLERCFHKLLINFAWWVNKVDREGNNIFEGGFLGMDNITVVDRSVSCRDGVVLEQSDATG